MKRFQTLMMASAALVLPWIPSCGLQELSSQASNITANEPMRYTLGDKEYPQSESIRRALMSAVSGGVLRIADIYGSAGEIEGIAIYSNVWFSCGGFWCVPADKVTRIYPKNGVVFATVDGVSLAVGSYTANEDGSIKQFEDLCTRAYKNSCDLVYDKNTNVYSFKSKS